MLIKKLSIPLEKLVVLSRICKIQQSLILTFVDSMVRSGLRFLSVSVISLFKFDFTILTNLVVSFTELCSFSISPKSLIIFLPETLTDLFKAFNKEKSYSESAIITRKTGELIHEITKNINSENSEKYITIYYCKNKTKNA